MKVRHDPPVHPGDNGKQGDERFRAIQKYPTATDTAIKRSRDNDTPAQSQLAGNEGSSERTSEGLEYP